MRHLKLLSDWADALEHLDSLGDWKERGFDMRYWAGETLPKSPELGCGTVCCAYGVGTTLSSWKEAGLTLEEDLDDMGGLVAATGFSPVRGARRILGLSEDEWFWIVDPQSYIVGSRTYFDDASLASSITPKMVAERIRAMLKEERWAYLKSA